MSQKTNEKQCLQAAIDGVCSRRCVSVAAQVIAHHPKNHPRANLLNNMLSKISKPQPSHAANNTAD